MYKLYPVFEKRESDSYWPVLFVSMDTDYVTEKDFVPQAC